MRGKDKNDDFGVQQIRITPAYAGKSCRFVYFAYCLTDHPRLCGEKLLSPLAYVCLLRITPAYAGKSWKESGCISRIQDHPRLCGEKLSFLPLSRRVSGSPPPMRGKVSKNKHRGTGAGITPAYAGKRHLSFFAKRCGWDHPRLCGEKTRSAAVHDLTQGSPPPMRGKETPDCPNVASDRITPAYAGKSLPCLSSFPARRDHPRLCGEKEIPSDGFLYPTGSPPPMRGKD